MTPFFSIIIPVYNVAPYLRECLDSLLAQTFTDWEAVCVDDGSTDGSGAILDEYAAKDKRFRIHHLANSGPAFARNFGVKFACGQFILFVDGDDIYPRDDILANFHQVLSVTKVDIAGGELIHYHKTQSNKWEFSDVQKEYSFDKNGLLKFSDYQFDWGFTRFAYRRLFLDKFSLAFPLLRYYEDPVFLVKAMVAAGEFYAMKCIVYGYRQLDHSLSNVQQYKRIDALMGFLEVSDIARRHNFTILQELMKRRFVYMCDAWNDSILQSDELWRLANRISEVLSADQQQSVLRYVLNRKVNILTSSVSYRIGRMITSPWRLMCCVRNNVLNLGR